MPSDSDSFVCFKNVQKSYDGETLVVKNLNLEIKAGEFLTMLGPSGSGKTTCLMMLAGFETVTDGNIELGGKPLNNIPPHKRDIGMVFQNYALFPHMTVAENLAFPLKVREMSSNDVKNKVNRALSMVQMLPFADRKPAQLSGGQQQRIALARALVFDPKLVLMDEPLGALDKQLREHMQYEIKRIHENLGMTIVYVTHDQSEALTMSNRIAVFHDGVIQQVSDPVTLYEKPKNSFVAQFIGENNTIPGTINEKKADMVSVRLDNGDKVNALALNVNEKGSRTSLSIRPERCVISNEKQTGLNYLKGKIEQLLYLGDHIRCHIYVAENNTFIVKIPNTSSDLGLKIGNETYVGWQTSDCRALDFREN